LNAPRDGHSLLFATPIETVQTPMALKVRYQTEDLRLVGLVASSNMLLLVRSNLPVKTVEELVAYARKAGPGKELTFGSVGRRSGFHLVAERFALDVGIKMVHVPYKGVAPQLSDLAGGQIDLAFMTLGGPVLGMIKADRFNPIGFAATSRHPELPNVPTMAETGLVKDFDFDLWVGLFVAKETPVAAVRRLSGSLGQALAQSAVRAELAASGITPASAMTLDEATRLLVKDTARYRAIGKAIQLQPE
jgi:tripartite-type tricarboxylate transporter receptor subunit TctC